MIGDAQARNYKRWPILGKYVWPNYIWKDTTFADEVDNFKEFLFNRLHWIDQNIKGNLLQPSVRITGSGYRVIVKLYDERFSTTVLKPSDFILNHAPYGIEIAAIDYLSSSECAFLLSQTVNQSPEFSVTVNESVLNGYHDLLSNPLSAQGIGTGIKDAGITVYEDHGMIHIRSDRPWLLPSQASVVTLTGQQLCSFQLEKIPDNILLSGLPPGIYFILFSARPVPLIKKIVITE